MLSMRRLVELLVIVTAAVELPVHVTVLPLIVLVPEEKVGLLSTRLVEEYVITILVIVIPYFGVKVIDPALLPLPVVR